jgi:prolyl oligopeptidase
MPFQTASALFAPGSAARVRAASSQPDECSQTMPSHAMISLRSIVPGAATAALLLMPLGVRGATPAAPPVAAIKPVVDDYFGFKVTDNYRWFENDQDPAFVSWLKGEADYAQAVLATIPGRDELQARVQQLSDSTVSVPSVEVAGGRYFYLKAAPGDDNRKLYVREAAPGSPERLLVDPTKLTAAGQHYSIDYFVPSPDGKKLAYALSPGGGEQSVLHVLSADDGKDLGESIDRTELANPVWSADNRGFYYNRLQKLAPDQPPTDKYLNSHACYHLLGSDADKDEVLLGKGLNPGVEILETDTPVVEVSPASPFAFGVLAHGVLNEQTIYVAPIAELAGVKTPWKKLVDVAAGVTGFDVHGDTAYLLSHHDASNFKVISVDLKTLDVAQARVIVPPGSSVVKGIAVARDALYVQTLESGLGRLERVPFDGTEAGKPAPLSLPFEGAINGLAADPDRPGVTFSLEGWVHSKAYFSYEPQSGKSADTGLAPASPVDFSGYEARELTYKAPDGVMVPLSLITKKGLPLDGNAPALLYAYGAYGITIDPTFNPALLAWLERGGIFAVAHVRGGGELGEDWHLAGMKLNKENTIRDYIAAGQWLVDNKYTSPAKLGGRGGSAGGITMGGAITQAPSLFAAIISEVGAHNSLRDEFSPNGPPNIPEFGSVKDLEGYKALAGMDTYEAVKKGVAYPAVMLVTGVNDPRVPVWEPAKMTAALQADSSSGKPIIFRVDYDAGHGIGSTKSQTNAKVADEYAFLLWQFGEPGFQPKK